MPWNQYTKICVQASLTLHSSLGTSRWLQELWRWWVLLWLKVQSHRSSESFHNPFLFDKFVNQYNNKTTAYPHHAGLRRIPKDGIVWFINVSSETETDIESSGIKKTVY